MSILSVVDCPECKGKTGCDCYRCWGRGHIPSPAANQISAYIGVKVKALVDADGVENDGDVCELLRVLDRIVRGRPIDKAFGAPGDWGYEHPIGMALAGRSAKAGAIQ